MSGFISIHQTCFREYFQSSFKVLSFPELTISFPAAVMSAVLPRAQPGQLQQLHSKLSAQRFFCLCSYEAGLCCAFPWSQQAADESLRRSLSSKELLQPVFAENQPCTSSNGKLALQRPLNWREGKSVGLEHFTERRLKCE